MGAGNGVRVTLTSTEACTATSQTERHLTDMLHRAVPWLESVEIVVGQGHQSLSDYVRTHCRPITLPGGAGRVLLTQEGSTLGSTNPFSVTSKNWSIEYINGSGLLQITVLRNGAPTARPLMVVKRGPGRFVVPGAGRFSLQITSVGDWTIRVRDGA